MLNNKYLNLQNQASSMPLMKMPQMLFQKTYHYKYNRFKHFIFVALADGTKRIFTNNDAVSVYNETKIAHPKKFSLINLFINGILQPSENYIIQEGQITLLTYDVPEKDVPIVLQMIKFQ